MNDNTEIFYYQEILEETGEATLFQIDGADQDIWIPDSQIIALDENALTCEIPRWLYEKHFL